MSIIYTPPDSSLGTRWNWFKSELVTFPDGSQEMAHRHPNGAGWVADSCDVAMSVYVHCLACVYGGAVVRGNSELNQFSQIYGGAKVFGNVQLSVSSTGMPSNGFTAIRGNGAVYGDVILLDDGMKALELSDAGQIITSIMVNSTMSNVVPTNFAHISQLNARDFQPGGDIFPIPEQEDDLDFEDEAESGVNDQPLVSVAHINDECDQDIYQRMLHAKAAIRDGLPNIPNATQSANLRRTCAKIVMPIKKHFGSIAINSGFRAPAVNTAAGSTAVNSQHIKGEAVDIEVVGQSNLFLARWILANLDFDQLLLEQHWTSNPSSGWVHVSHKASGNRKDVRTFYDGRTHSVGLRPRK